MRTDKYLAIALMGVAGSASGQSVWYSHTGDTANMGYGFSVAGLGDLDQDGVDEYIVGAYKQGGFADVYSGATGTTLYEYHEFGCFGMAVADLGDISGDGVPDFAISSPREFGNCASCGIVRTYSGVDGSLLYQLEGDTPTERFGYSISSADVNNDGVGDLIIGSFWDDVEAQDSGHVNVFNGPDGAHLYSVSGLGGEDDWFGTDVAAIGDVNGDGHEDFAVGAPQQWYVQAFNPPAGYARVFSGQDGSTITTFPGYHAGDHYGSAVAGIGDITGDGVPDIAIGCPRLIVDEQELGMVELRAGGTGTLLGRIFGQPGSKFGTAVTPAGDYDHDGVPDILIGACYCQNTDPTSPLPGYAQVRSGADFSVLAQMNGKSGQAFAFAVDSLGDITGDGTGDFLIGNNWDDVLGTHTGSAQVFSGSTLSLVAGAHQLSISAGGLHPLEINAGGDYRDLPYFVLGSISGTTPGLPLGQVVLPLNLDAYMQFSIVGANSQAFQNTSGFLDIDGHADAAVELAPGLLGASAVGLVLNHAYVVQEFGDFVFSSNATQLTLVP